MSNIAVPTGDSSEKTPPTPLVVVDEVPTTETVAPSKGTESSATDAANTTPLTVAVLAPPEPAVPPEPPEPPVLLFSSSPQPTRLTVKPMLKTNQAYLRIFTPK